MQHRCDERIQKIQTIKMMEGIFICAAPHCLKSFMKKSEFEDHIHESHYDLLNPNAEKEEGNESEARNLKQHTATESTARGPPRQAFSPGPFQLHDHGDKAHNLQSLEQPPTRSPLQRKKALYYGQMNNPSQSQADNRHPPSHHSLRQEQGQFHEKPQGISSNVPFHEYPPLNPIPKPNFMMPLSSTPMLNPVPPFGFPIYQPEGGPQVFSSGPYNVMRQDSAPEAGAEQGSSFGFPPSGMNFAAGYPTPWNAEMGGSHFNAQGSIQGLGDNYQNQGDLMQNPPGALPLNPLLPPPNMPNSGSAE